MKVTIVTVTFNCKNVIEETLLSVINQSYKDIEYIIIDGGSNDGTLEIINKYSSQISKIVSEPDKGIFDAMNKSLQYCNGEYVIFINAGDKFVNTDVLTTLFKDKVYTADLLYGDTYTQSEFGYKLIKANAIYSQKHNSKDLVFKSQGICHQSLFTKLHILKNIGFDLNYPIGADYDTTNKVFQKGNHELYYVGLPVSVFDDRFGGASHYKIIKMYRERFQMFNYKPTFIDYIKIYKMHFIVCLKQILENCFPRIIKEYRKKKYVTDYGKN